MADRQFCTELEHFLEIVQTVPIRPSYFELLLAFALWTFVSNGVDYAVVETGIGGRFDATNIVTRADKVCVITNIGLDHTHLLGNSLSAITWHKIGIVHPHNSVFMFAQARSIMAVAQAWVDQQAAALTIVHDGVENRLNNREMQSMPAYQQQNWWLAYKVYCFLQSRDRLPPLNTDALHKTQLLSIPGRMDIRRIGPKTIVMDGAHNVQKMKVFASSFRLLYPGVRPTILIGSKRNQDFQRALPTLSQVASDVIVTTIHSRHKQTSTHHPKKLADTVNRLTNIPVRTIPDQQTAVDTLLASPGNVVVIIGSFHLLGQLRRLPPLVKPN